MDEKREWLKEEFGSKEGKTAEEWGRGEKGVLGAVWRLRRMKEGTQTRVAEQVLEKLRSDAVLSQAEQDQGTRTNEGAPRDKNEGGERSKSNKFS